jgi:hypothetical protein
MDKRGLAIPSELLEHISLSSKFNEIISSYLELPYHSILQVGEAGRPNVSRPACRCRGTLLLPEGNGKAGEGKEES